MQIHLPHEKYTALGLQVLWKVKEQHLKKNLYSLEKMIPCNPRISLLSLMAYLENKLSLCHQVAGFMVGND